VTDLKSPSRVDVVFVFVDYGDKNLYQLKQWTQSLERLAKSHSVAVLHSSFQTEEYLKTTELRGYHFVGQEQLAQRLAEIQPKLMLYPNQNVRNFYVLRYPSAIHAFVSHGESDEAYMAQNTIKRYDLYFAAGSAARERIKNSVADYDQARIFEIGRPQAMDVFSLPGDLVQSEKKKLLYAPTWEGVTRATRYSSIDTHGENLIKAAIESGEYQITYRPHPLSGTRDRPIREANERIKKLLKQANRTDKSANHYLDSSTFGWHLDYHDLMVSDISAIAYDWLSTGKPILLTKPADKKAVILEFPLVNSLRSIKAKEASNISLIYQEELSRKDSPHKELSSHYFRQPISGSDEYLEEAVGKALSIQERELEKTKFDEIENYVARGSRLGLLRYPNFVIREFLRLTGTWSTQKILVDLPKVENVFLHFSDPFNYVSLDSALRNLLSHSMNSDEPVVLLTNQVTSLLRARALCKKEEFSKLRERLIIVPVANAADCEAVVQRIKPSKAHYLKHHPLNHMMLRLNGFSHELFMPDSDPLFKPDHSVIVYDRLVGIGSETKTYLELLPKVSRPKY
jgi:hypothetical protein